MSFPRKQPRLDILLAGDKHSTLSTHRRQLPTFQATLFNYARAAGAPPRQTPRAGCRRQAPNEDAVPSSNKKGSPITGSPYIPHPNCLNDRSVSLHTLRPLVLPRARPFLGLECAGLSASPRCLAAYKSTSPATWFPCCIRRRIILYAPWNIDCIRRGKPLMYHDTCGPRLPRECLPPSALGQKIQR